MLVRWLLTVTQGSVMNCGNQDIIVYAYILFISIIYHIPMDIRRFESVKSDGESSVVIVTVLAMPKLPLWTMWQLND